MKTTLVFILAAAIGLLIGWVDTRPTWDDTGITVGSIMIAAALFGVAVPRRAWLWAFTIRGGVTGLNIAVNNSYSAAVSLPLAFIGAYLGVALRKGFGSVAEDRQ